jgi:hypothetical protein
LGQQCEPFHQSGDKGAVTLGMVGAIENDLQGETKFCDVLVHFGAINIPVGFFAPFILLAIEKMGICTKRYIAAGEFRVLRMIALDELIGIEPKDLGNFLGQARAHLHHAIFDLLNCYSTDSDLSAELRLAQSQH